ncbi:MAG: 3-phosphoshikimate 1-carboxyvinyltransferase, partial [Deltaproteobacteria bacterium]|nr:3-phosphoshikimate 1-carboxyvinyltransferase [Deltaproteobacteria bacterium]
MSLRVKPSTISGNAAPLDCPPDKSVTHRSFLFALLSTGKTVVRRPLLGEDCLASLAAVEKLGAKVKRDGERIEISGFGVKEFGAQPPKAAPLRIDCQNSGTTIRLLSGLLAGQHGHFHLFGDASLSQRPMKRVSEPLHRMGAAVFPRGEKRGSGAPVPTPPVDVEPAPGGLKPLAYDLNIASAQVKSAVLLAGLFCSGGETSVTEPSLSRDHTERML